MGRVLSVADVQQLVLDALSSGAEGTEAFIADTLRLAASHDVGHQHVVGAMKGLEALSMVVTEQLETPEWTLTGEGLDIAETGSHEVKVFHSIPASDGIEQVALMQHGGFAKIGFAKAMSNAWIRLDKDAVGGPRVYRKVDAVHDMVQEALRRVKARAVASIDAELLRDLKKRKLIAMTVIKSYSIRRGPAYARTLVKSEAELTQDMIASGAWRAKTFKAYNFEADGVPVDGGHLHPLMKVRSELRHIFTSMGFQEMPTNNYVESSFWNFDSLFQPQQHPARDSHDTFFVKDPERTIDLPEEYAALVKQAHERGVDGSIGYRYEWKTDEAQKNILRTHTTAVSARMLYSLAREPQFRPVKYFSIDKVFRNEAMDATHLAEFHQVEGLVADYGLTLGDLIGVISSFFKAMNITELRFKPAYNPYTEPSMEVFGFHKGLNRWVEVGNSGIFRPEMLRPMGLPEGVAVIAWGLSLERPTMIKYGINNIRDLVGHKVDLRMVAGNPICRIDRD